MLQDLKNFLSQDIKVREQAQENLISRCKENQDSFIWDLLTEVKTVQYLPTFICMHWDPPEYMKRQSLDNNVKNVLAKEFLNIACDHVDDSVRLSATSVILEIFSQNMFTGWPTLFDEVEIRVKSGSATGGLKLLENLCERIYLNQFFDEFGEKYMDLCYHVLKNEYDNNEKTAAVVLFKRCIIYFRHLINDPLRGMFIEEHTSKGLEILENLIMEENSNPSLKRSIYDVCNEIANYHSKLFVSKGQGILANLVNDFANISDNSQSMVPLLLLLEKGTKFTAEETESVFSGLCKITLISKESLETCNMCQMFDIIGGSEEANARGAVRNLLKGLKTSDKQLFLNKICQEIRTDENILYMLECVLEDSDINCSPQMYDLIKRSLIAGDDWVIGRALIVSSKFVGKNKEIDILFSTFVENLNNKSDAVSIGVLIALSKCDISTLPRKLQEPMLEMMQSLLSKAGNNHISLILSGIVNLSKLDPANTNPLDLLLDTVMAKKNQFIQNWTGETYIKELLREVDDKTYTNYAQKMSGKLLPMMQVEKKLHLIEEALSMLSQFIVSTPLFSLPDEFVRSTLISLQSIIVSQSNAKIVKAAKSALLLLLSHSNLTLQGSENEIVAIVDHFAKTSISQVIPQISPVVDILMILSEENIALLTPQIMGIVANGLIDTQGTINKHKMAILCYMTNIGTQFVMEFLLSAGLATPVFLIWLSMFNDEQNVVALLQSIDALSKVYFLDHPRVKEIMLQRESIQSGCSMSIPETMNFSTTLEETILRQFLKKLSLKEPPVSKKRKNSDSDAEFKQLQAQIVKFLKKLKTLPGFETIVKQLSSDEQKMLSTAIAS